MAVVGREKKRGAALGIGLVEEKGVDLVVGQQEEEGVEEGEEGKSPRGAEVEDGVGGTGVAVGEEEGGVLGQALEEEGEGGVEAGVGEGLGEEDLAPVRFVVLVWVMGWGWCSWWWWWGWCVLLLCLNMGSSCSGGGRHRVSVALWGEGGVGRWVGGDGREGKGDGWHGVVRRCGWVGGEGAECVCEPRSTFVSDPLLEGGGGLTRRKATRPGTPRGRRAVAPCPPRGLLQLSPSGPWRMESPLGHTPRRKLCPSLKLWHGRKSRFDDSKTGATSVPQQGKEGKRRLPRGARPAIAGRKPRRERACVEHAHVCGRRVVLVLGNAF